MAYRAKVPGRHFQRGNTKGAGSPPRGARGARGFDLKLPSSERKFSAIAEVSDDLFSHLP